MSEHCEVFFTTAADRELRAVARKDPQRYLVIQSTIAQVVENGWLLSLRAELVKVFHGRTCLGEIRDVGSGGYRLFFFWHDTWAEREIWICRVLPKRDVTGKRRLNEICDSVEAMRRRFYEEET
jgi:hypothetical protein